MKQRSKVTRFLCTAAAGIVVVAFSGACQEPAIDGPVDARQAERIRVEKPIDILFVVDNSGSMCEEQETLRRAFFQDDDCPVGNFEPGANGQDQALTIEAAAGCGFAQTLAAYGNDFRVGVITTDVSMCDNRFGLAENIAVCNDGRIEADWGRRPQRGCLQAPDGWDKKYLERSDERPVERFSQIVDSIGVWGSGYERGLDAVEVFLDPDAQRAPGCEDDLDDFLREDARLAVVFLTDEDDCSHADGEYGFRDENEGDGCQLDDIVTPTEGLTPAHCYQDDAAMAPVARYAEALRRIKPDPEDVSVFTIGGFVPDEVDSPMAAGCAMDAQGSPAGSCMATMGNSAGQDCEGAEPACCTAEAATRYESLAQQLDTMRSGVATICQESFAPALSLHMQSLCEPQL